MRIHLESIGCRLNTGELQALALRLEEFGHSLVDSGETADLCVVNTCAVTAVASQKSRQAVKRLRRSNPSAVVVATGCLAELEPTSLRSVGTDQVIGNRDKDRLVELLGRTGVMPTAGATRFSHPPGARSGPTRAFLKVQDGCDNRCAYCVVRLARGPGRSVEPDEVVAEVRRRENLAYREVVLTGVHLGSYGHDLGRGDGLAELVARLLAETSVERLRLSSVEPWDVHRELLELFANQRLLPHLHLPLQSGSDATLRRMARKTTTAEFATLVGEIRARVPRAAISTDVMVGFPGESEQEFLENLAFVAATRFSRLHVFRFSPRRGTPAAAMTGQVPAAVTRERAATFRHLADQLETEFNRGLVGATLPVLWEASQPCAGRLRWSGLTPCFVRAVADTEAGVDLANRIADTLVVGTIPGGVRGRLLAR